MSGNRLKKIEQKVFSFIRRNKLFSKGDKILVAFSGGADSAFVLSFLQKHKAILGIEVTAAHVNHKLRGKEAERDEKHCEEFAKKTGVEFHSVKVNVKNFAKENKLSLEAAARTLRYEALNEIAQKIGADKIVTAHNLNDNAETVLLNLLKGGGTKAVAGIPVSRKNIVRPALSVTREEIEYWNEKHNVKFVNDSTNFENEFLRNRLRNIIFPIIEKEINPKAAKAVFNFSQILEAQNRIIDKITDEARERIFEKNRFGYALNYSKLTETDMLNFGNIVISALRLYFGIEIGFEEVEKIKELTDKEKGKQYFFKNGLIITKEADKLIFGKETSPEQVYLEFTPNAEIETADFVITVLGTKRKKRKEGCELIAADNLGKKFVLRNWRAGDKFKPLGMSVQKKISDFLTDLKIPSLEKKKVLVLENNGKIIWVVGYRISDEVKLTEQTNKRIELCANTKI